MKSSEVLRRVLADVVAHGCDSRGVCSSLDAFGYACFQKVGTEDDWDWEEIPLSERSAETIKCLEYVKAYSKFAHTPLEAASGEFWFSSLEERIIALEHAIEFAESQGD